MGKQLTKTIDVEKFPIIVVCSKTLTRKQRKESNKTEINSLKMIITRRDLWLKSEQNKKQPGYEFIQNSTAKLREDLSAVESCKI
jgi:hypothetical protein